MYNRAGMNDTENKTICIIGGANIDICGSSIGKLRNYDSNPGTISISYGGVGRNIAQICALLSENVRFVTCFSDDSYGKMMKEDCEKLGMNTRGSTILHDLPSSMYIAILDENRDMKIAMSDMRILRRMDAAMLAPVLKELSSDDMIIIDANLDLESVQFILKHAPCPVAADPVSTAKAGRLKEDLGKIDIFKPNQFEAAELTGIQITDDRSASESIRWFLDHGVKEVLISMADRGILLGTEKGSLWYTHRVIKLENATGGGDSLLGAYVSRRVLKEEPEQAIQFAISTAVTVIEEDAVRRKSLCAEAVINNIESMEIKERKI